MKIINEIIKRLKTDVPCLRDRKENDFTIKECIKILKEEAEKENKSELPPNIKEKYKFAQQHQNDPIVVDSNHLDYDGSGPLLSKEVDQSGLSFKEKT